MADLTIVEGDIGTRLVAQLVNANGPVNLTGATAVQLRVDIGGTPTSFTSTVVVPGLGIVSVDLASISAPPGVYPYQHCVTWESGVFQFFPSDRTKILEVLPHTRART